MPLSKERNRDRMRLIRLHKRSLSPQERKSVQPKTLATYNSFEIPKLDAERAAQLAYDMLEKARWDRVQIDADGNVIPEEEWSEKVFTKANG